MAKSFGGSEVGTSGINGDAFYISSDNSTLVLADGASGAGKEGKVLMSHCCVKKIEEYPFADSGLSPKQYLDKMIKEINNELIELSQRKGNYIFGTIVICVIEKDTATFASMGDSPAFLIHGTNIRRVAKAKKTYNNLIDMGLFTEEQLEEYVHKLPEHMWSMFEQFIPMVVPEYTYEECKLGHGDIIILCCDGVSDYLSPDELRQMIDSEELSESVDQIISAAKNKTIQERKKIRYDDITVVLYQH